MKKITLNKTLKLPIRLLKRYKARRKVIAQLLSHEYPKLKAIGDAFYEALNNILSSEERDFIALIEQRRSFLLSSDKMINVIDYGAGSSSSNRSKEEMEGGFQSKELIANICRASKPKFWAVLLFKLVRKLEPLSCVELGSCVGISTSYQAMALKLNGRGNLLTLEGSPEIAKIARETLSTLNLKNTSVITGPFNKTLKGALESIKPVDFFFNDGHHDYDAVMQYFHETLNYLSDEAVIVLDDISWSQGMIRAWTKIEDDERVAVSINLQKMGIVLIGNRLATKEKFRIAL